MMKVAQTNNTTSLTLGMSHILVMYYCKISCLAKIFPTYRTLQFLILSVTIEPYMPQCAVYAPTMYVSV